LGLGPDECEAAEAANALDAADEAATGIEKAGQEA
jgi:hypothetical protein